ncbi:DNA repair protein RecO [Clostridium sp. MB40-C1]|uniref:DNA repair protein RecO n=1 Tax=Clostridium sp. MB40-C1 TaxID=3070996 RepID=UPI0027DEBEE8|nr:DNA repair protein RecO [Clostridium sp. MB40-C1]WMJ82438.1 DNA repair protein RecO [Clostridium sp. MB40-C1]
MSVFKSRGVVLKTQDYKENDKLLWIFCEKIGKVCAIARGAKKGKSKFLSSTQQFCFGEYVLYRGKNLFTVNEIEIIDSFQDILKDIDSITFASYFCELILIGLQDEESNRDLFKDFVKALYLLKSKAVDLEILARSFELKILKATGYAFNFDRCSLCGNKLSTSNYISFQYNGGVCADCNKTNGIKISYPAYNILRFLNKTPIENISRISASQELKNEIHKILDIFISQNYSRKPKSLEFYNYLKRSDCNE